MLIGGVKVWEEINFQSFSDIGGNNYGWNIMEETIVILKILIAAVKIS